MSEDDESGTPKKRHPVHKGVLVLYIVYIGVLALYVVFLDFPAPFVPRYLTLRGLYICSTLWGALRTASPAPLRGRVLRSRGSPQTVVAGIKTPLTLYKDLKTPLTLHKGLKTPLTLYKVGETQVHLRVYVKA